MHCPWPTQADCLVIFHRQIPKGVQLGDLLPSSQRGSPEIREVNATTEGHSNATAIDSSGLSVPADSRNPLGLTQRLTF